MQEFFQVLIARQDQLIERLLQHIQLTVIAIVIAVAVGVPLGILITRNKKLAALVIGFANLVQAIPSIALLGFLIPFIGIGSTPAIIMVVLYSMLPILKNTYTGLMNISPSMLEVAKGIGLTRQQTLRLIKLPLAIPVIMAGVRISSVTAVGLMTIAAFVGAGGLGYLVFTGIEAVDMNLILLGAIPAAILALIIDFIVGKIENAAIPNGISITNGGGLKRKNRLSAPLKKTLAVGTAMILIIFIGFSIFQSMSKKTDITIASKSFTEQLIVGNIVAELIENRTDLNVERKLNLGATQIIFGAMQVDEVDIYVEYSGTAYSSILNHEADGNKSAEEVFATVEKDLKDRHGIQVIAPLGFNNTYAMVVKPETAEQYNLKTISDLVPISNQLTLTPTLEFVEREDGLIGMEKAYNIKFRNVMPMQGALRYKALASDEADVIDGFTTDGLIEKENLVVLEDDKNFFLPYYAFIMARAEILEQYPEVEKILKELEERISEDTMRKLNYQVDVEGKEPEAVAREYLISENLIFE